MIRLSPLRYPGGKSKYIDYIEPLVPTDFENFIEPFCGGASVSLYFAKKYPQKNFIINDIDYKLYCFWKNLKNNSNLLIKNLLNITKKFNIKIEKDGKNLYKKMKKQIQSKNELEIASAYFILNRIVFGGMTEIATFSKTAWEKKYLTMEKIVKLKEVSENMKNIKVENKDYKELLDDNFKNAFVFLDPPYKIKDSLYGNNGENHENFNHKYFCQNIKKLKYKILITYNNSKWIKNWIGESKFNIIKKEYNYCINYNKNEKGNLKRKKEKELIITNY